MKKKSNSRHILLLLATVMACTTMQARAAESPSFILMEQNNGAGGETLYASSLQLHGGHVTWNSAGAGSESFVLLPEGDDQLVEFAPPVPAGGGTVFRYLPPPPVPAVSATPPPLPPPPALLPGAPAQYAAPPTSAAPVVTPPVAVPPARRAQPPPPLINGVPQRNQIRGPLPAPPAAAPKALPANSLGRNPSPAPRTETMQAPQKFQAPQGTVPAGQGKAAPSGGSPFIPMGTKAAPAPLPAEKRMVPPSPAVQARQDSRLLRLEKKLGNAPPGQPSTVAPIKRTGARNIRAQVPSRRQQTIISGLTSSVLSAAGAFSTSAEFLFLAVLTALAVGFLRMRRRSSRDAVSSRHASRRFRKPSSRRPHRP